MAYKLNEKLKKFTNYEVTDGEYRIRLDANESFIDPGIGLHNRIIDALSKVPLNRYPDDSCKELRKAFGTYYGVDPALVVAGNGSDELISLLIGSFMKKDEKIVTLTPDFSMYKVFADIFERECIEILKDEDLSISTDYLLEELKRINPQAIIFSNPSSPTGLVKKRSEIVKSLFDR
jgi:histidinol-phosphate aminotransferase